ncbi:kelch domain-containing protein 10-like [Styela clava]
MDCKDDTIVGVNKLIRLNPSTGQDSPSARSGHRAVANETHMWVLGGYNPGNVNTPLFREIWRLNIATGQWNLMQCEGDMPGELASHSTIIDNSHMLVFGGTGYPFGINSSNKLSVCNLRSGVWRELKCDGNLPDEKYGQAMTLYKRKLIVHGGTSGYFYNTDLHKLNLKTLKWNRIIPNNVFSEMPAERYRHEIALFQDNLIILGGGTSNSVNNLRILHSFNFKTTRWTCRVTKPDTLQNPGYPAPRRCHGCVQLQDEAVISGGYDGIRITGDVWKINLRTMQWTKITDMIEPVYFHSATVTPDGRMYIFGGVSCIEPNIRTASCYRMWLRLPSLQTLCWQKLLNSFPQLKKLPHKKLIELGVNRSLTSQLPYPVGA